MMLEKTPGAVGCGHCQQLGARRTCAGCGRPVCDACARRWESCPVPAARVLRLGLGRRLRAVDEHGRLGLVSSWHPWRWRLVDLSAPAWVDRPCPSHPYMPFPLLSDGRVLQARSNYAKGFWGGVQISELWPGGGQSMVKTPVFAQPPRIFRACHEAGLCLLVTDTEAAEVIDVARGEIVSSVSDHGHVIHAVDASAALDLIALGSYRRVALFRLGGGRPLTVLKNVGSDDLFWIGLSRTRLALLDSAGALEVHELDPGRGAVGAQIYTGRAIVKQRLQSDLSADGRLLVTLGGRDRPVLHDLEARRSTVLPGHSDDVHLVRFVRGGRLLITADEDNRVILWPRLGDGLADRVLPQASLPGEPVAWDGAMRAEGPGGEAASGERGE